MRNTIKPSRSVDPSTGIPPVIAILGMLVTFNCTHGDELPELADDRLELRLFAEDPDIVTPIGIAIDGDDRVFVVESHTHLQASDYDGPEGDRIKIFVDDDKDGRADRSTIFAEGLQQAMNLAFAPDGQLYAACTKEVVKLVDEDGDGVCDRQQPVVKLETLSTYAHTGIMGITFSRDGWMYISRGNVGSYYFQLSGSDESRVEGYGDGGNVARCRPDGSELEEFATGFWNPFSLRFDRNGRLLLVDNDPDARGPNRLVQIVRDGDYGYKSIYGGSGNHPFQGWDGSLPGTLPFVAGTGEAPCDLLDCRQAGLPADYRDSTLVTVWNENKITRFDLIAKGATLASREEATFMSGGQNFRPVAIRSDSHGNIYIADWVLVNYPNHGRGRIWRVHCKTDNISPPQPEFAPYLPDPIDNQGLEQTSDSGKIIEALKSQDAFLRHAARRRLSEPQLKEQRELLAEHPDARVRLGSLLATKKHALHSTGARQFLGDPDETVRRAALMWAGQSLQTDLRGDLETALRSGPVNGVVFQTYLAAVENLEPAFVNAYQTRETSRSNRLKRQLAPQVLIEVARDKRFSASVRSMAVGQYTDETVQEQSDWLAEQMSIADETLVLAIIRRLAATEISAESQQRLAELALDQNRSSQVRCEALAALAVHPAADPHRFLSLLQSNDSSVATEAARTLCGWFAEGAASDLVEPIKGGNWSDEVLERLTGIPGSPIQQPSRATRPQSIEDWSEALGQGGNSSRGRRVFFSRRVGCAKCHTIGGRGGVLGPDLSGVAQSKTRQQIIQAVLDPSADFPPQYQAWIVITTDGRIHRGLQLDHKAKGAIVLTGEDGKNRYFKGDEIDQYDVSQSSLMPAGLAETMSVGEFQDLIAFLVSLR